MDEKIEKKQYNAYDSKDIVRRERVLTASDAGVLIKMAAYRVYDPETEKHSNLQFHFTSGDTVCAVMGESVARLFSNFIRETLGIEGETGLHLQKKGMQLEKAGE